MSKVRHLNLWLQSVRRIYTSWTSIATTGFRSRPLQSSQEHESQNDSPRARPTVDVNWFHESKPVARSLLVPLLAVSSLLSPTIRSMVATLPCKLSPARTNASTVSIQSLPGLCCLTIEFLLKVLTFFFQVSQLTSMKNKGPRCSTADFCKSQSTGLLSYKRITFSIGVLSHSSVTVASVFPRRYCITSSECTQQTGNGESMVCQNKVRKPSQGTTNSRRVFYTKLSTRRRC